jgi:hypothetical protein
LASEDLGSGPCLVTCVTSGKSPGEPSLSPLHGEDATWSGAEEQPWHGSLGRMPGITQMCYNISVAIITEKSPGNPKQCSRSFKSGVSPDFPTGADLSWGQVAHTK